MNTILMPIDFSDTTDRAVEFVAELAPKMESQVDVLYVSESDLADPQQGREVLSPRVDEVVDRLKKRGCKATPHLVFGPPALSILDQIDVLEPHIVVMGSHGHTALHDLLMGSVTHSVLRSGKCPVLIVPSPRPESEVPPQGIDTSDLADLYGFPGM
jgi:nucleotide-binding universal stress UspA family protein